MMETIIFECDICGCDKYHVCRDDNDTFISCAHCGVRTTIDIEDAGNLK
jgi:hypothetical protein